MLSLQVSGLEVSALGVPCRTCGRAAGLCCVEDGREVDYVHEARVTDELLQRAEVVSAPGLDPLLVACPACAQQPHEGCVDLETWRPMETVHEERRRQAAAIHAALSAGDNVMITDAQLLRTGLV